MQKKAILMIFILIAIAILIFVLFFAIPNKEEKLGEIKEISSVSLSENGNSYEVESEDALTKDGKSKIFNDFYGGYQFKYPASYTRENKSANHIHLKKDNCFIQIEHTLILEDEELLDKIEALRLIELFEAKLLSERIEIDSNTYTRDNYQNPISDLKNGIKEKSDNEFLLGQDFTPLKVRNENDEIKSNIASERRYYLYNGKCATVISLVCPSDEFEKEKKVLDGILESRTPISETYSQVYTESTHNITLNIPKFYSEIKSVYTLGDGVVYHCPPTSSSTLAGSFIAIYENKEGYLLKHIRDISPLDLFFDVYERSSKSLSQSNFIEFQKIENEKYNPFSYLKEQGYSVNTYISAITLLPTTETESRILDLGNSIDVYIISLEKDGKETNIVISAQTEMNSELWAVMQNLAGGI